jgi:hypothetical protein
MLYEIPDGDLNNGVLYQLQIYAEYERRAIWWKLQENF